MENHIQFKDMPHQFTMIAIEGTHEGKPFDMGVNGYTNHDVRLSQYWIGEIPVTQSLWVHVMQDTGMPDPFYFKGDKRPVEQVSWKDIEKEFLPRLNKITEWLRPKGMEYRLPTEAQWEYAARGGKYWKEHPFRYSGSNKINEVAWYSENSHRETKPVGLKTPNLLGLYDMSGNVWEWCEDWYDSEFYRKCKKQGVVLNPCNRVEGSARVICGGSWFNDSGDCRTSYRDPYPPSNSYSDLGFRLVLFFPSV